MDIFSKYKDPNSKEYLEIVEFINKKVTIICHIDLLLTRYNIIKDNEQDKYILLLNAIENRLSRVCFINEEIYSKIDKIFDEIPEERRRIHFIDRNERIISILKKNFDKNKKRFD